LNISRRDLLTRGASIAFAASLPISAVAIQPKPANAPASHSKGETETNMITTKDGTKIYFKDWGTGPTVVFSHGWPLNADAWDAQMLFLAQKGYRVIAHDRRGHGRSSQPWNGNEMDTYADDLAALIEALDLSNITLVGHSTGGGEVARYIGRHGSKRVSKAVLIGAVPPIMLKTISQGVRDSFWRQGMEVSIAGAYDCIKAFSETDFTGDLKKIDVPTLILHGDADQIVPIADSALLTAKIVKNSTLKVIAGAPHGMCTTRADEINAELLAFLQSGKQAAA
jgi:non-heme chloroperoxidase